MGRISIPYSRDKNAANLIKNSGKVMLDGNFQNVILAEKRESETLMNFISCTFKSRMKVSKLQKTIKLKETRHDFETSVVLIGGSFRVPNYSANSSWSEPITPISLLDFLIVAAACIFLEDS